MVPDFEVELEAGIEQTISEVAEMMADTVEVEEESTVTSPVNNTKTKDLRLRLLIAAAAAVGLILIIGIIHVVKSVRSYYSFDDQFRKVENEFVSGEYEDAVKTAKHVISLNPEDERARLLLADSYFALKKYDESIAILSELVGDFPKDTGIYERLIANYEIEGDVESIIRLSEKADGQALKDLFKDYACDDPQFSEEGGNYYEPQAIKLMTTGSGTVYYTTDGSYPDESGEVYTRPIQLDEGETTIRAIHINDKGVKSKEVSKTYNIIKVAPATPKLLTQGGDYSIPKLINVEETQGATVYYTTDGTDPTIDSKEYEPPIPMPLGKSEFRFAIINDSGVSGEIVTAEYNLKISGIDSSYAAASVQLKLMSLGHDVSTHEFSAKYGYAQDARCYYIVEEYEGKKRQNTVYAVDSQTGEVFTIARNRDTGDYDFGVVK